MKNMSISKKVLGLMMALVMVFGSLSGGYVVAATNTNEITVTADGQRVAFEGQGPIIIDGTTLVPIRGVFEHIGFAVSWNGADRVATMTRGSDTIVITIDSFDFTTNGSEHALHVPAQIIDGRTLVPIRLPLESVGYNLVWDGPNRAVIITSGGNSTSAGNQNTETTPPPASNFTVTNPTTGATATASENGVHLTGPVFLTQDDIQRMLPYAREPEDHITMGRTDFHTEAGSDRLVEWIEETRAAETRHPDRPMTEQELQAWIERYNEQGGINALELEILYLLNEIRVEHGLQPFTLCPYLSMAARLSGQLARDGIRFTRHDDAIYGTPHQRANLFYPFDASFSVVLENLMMGPIILPEGPVNSWMNSPGHRDHILNPNRIYIGVGSTGFFATMHTSR